MGRLLHQGRQARLGLREPPSSTRRRIDGRCLIRLPLVLLSLFLWPRGAKAFSELKDVHFRGCAILEIPYVLPDENRREQFSGVAINYLDRLHDNLQFSFDMKLWERSWDELVNHMAVCDPDATGPDACECNLGVGPFTVTQDRVEKVSFVWAFGHENYQMVVRKSELSIDDSSNSWFVFKTFSTEVWIIILCGILMQAFGTVYYGPFRPSPHALPQERGHTGRKAGALCWQLKRFPAAILYAYSHFIGYPFDSAGQNTPSFHKTAWIVLGLTAGLFLITIYQASLTVLLFESTKSSPFRAITDVTECGLAPDRIAMVGGTASQEYWNFAVNTSAHRKQCSWGSAGIIVRDLEQGFRFLKENKADYFFDLEASILFRAHLNCDLFEPVGEPFFSTSVGFILPKKANATVLEILSRETRLLREADEYDSATVVASRNACDETVDATLTPGKLTAFFALYGVAWIILLVFRIVFLWRRKLNQQPTPEIQGMPTQPQYVMTGHGFASPFAVPRVGPGQDVVDSVDLDSFA